MKRLTNQYSFGQKAFTIIELLFVIVVLGLLAAVVVTNGGMFTG